MHTHIYIYTYLRCSAVCLARSASVLTRVDSAIAARNTFATRRDWPNAPASPYDPTHVNPIYMYIYIHINIHRINPSMSAYTYTHSIYTYIYLYLYLHRYTHIYLRCSAVCLARSASFFTRNDSAIAALSTSATRRDWPNAPASSSRIRRSLNSG